jgi:hypothetical protein
MNPTYITCTRWFQKSYGNTYHKVRLHYADGTTMISPMTYGYGDQCLFTALQMFEPGSTTHPSLRLRELGIPYVVQDVTRERDM